MIYLGRIAVVPRKGLKARAEGTPPGDEAQGETAYYEQLNEIFALAPAATAETRKEGDLCLDVALAGRHSGTVLDIELGHLLDSARGLAGNRRFIQRQTQGRPTWR